LQNQSKKNAQVSGNKGALAFGTAGRVGNVTPKQRASPSGTARRVGNVTPKQRASPSGPKNGWSTFVQFFLKNFPNKFSVGDSWDLIVNLLELWISLPVVYGNIPALQTGRNRSIG
jgi:hypothetical protein